MPTKFARWRSCVVARAALVLLLACAAASARGQQRLPPELSLRATAGVGVMTSEDQPLAPLEFDRAGLLGSLHVQRSFLDWLELRAGAHGGAFVTEREGTGGLLAATLGPSFAVPHHRLRPWLALDLGAGLTGLSVRPYLAVQLGLDARADAQVTIGPVVSYGQLFQWNHPDASTDARFIWVGVTMRFRGRARPLPPTRTVVRVERHVQREERVIEKRVVVEQPSEEILQLIERTVPTQTQRVELLAPVLFAFDSDRLEPIGIAMLHEVARTLAERQDIRVLQIEGYADGRGGADYNAALSLRRAERVRAWLIEHGVTPERLRVAPRGATGFVEPGQQESAHTQNRRVIFRVVELAEPNAEAP